MSPMEMVREIAGLASGTVANLCRSTSYQAIDDYTAGWIEWVARQPSLKRWKTWQECHTEYLNSF